MEEQYSAIVDANYYKNPIVFGNYADPSILRDGEDYYMVNSSCSNQHKLLLMWHSKDLVNWEALYYVYDGCYIQKLNQYMNVAWAPDLVKYKEKYYIYNCTPKYGCWVTTCDDINKGDWSDIHFIDGIKGIDPGHVVDDLGKRWLCMSDNIIYPLSDDGLSIIGQGKKICENWEIPENFDVEGICTEAPKFIHKDGYYYFVTAQGGTMGPATSHCVVSYRSKFVDGPYELSPYNPIIHTNSKLEKWWSKGHGTLIDTISGDWYIVYHAIENAHRYAGRITLLMPVKWTDDGWFTVSNKDDEILKSPIKSDITVCNGKLSVLPKDKQFGPFYNYYDKTVKDRIEFSSDSIEFICTEGNAWDTKSLTFMPQSHHYEYSISVSLGNENEGVSLGLSFNENINCGIYAQNGKINLYKHNFIDFKKDEVSFDGNDISLKFICNHGTISFWYSTDNNKWKKSVHAYDVSDWNPNIQKEFSCVEPGIKAFGTGIVKIKEIRYSNI